MARPTLKVYFDILSPFAYIAFHIVTHSPVFKKCEVQFVPALLGGILKHCGNTAPLFIRNKDKWIDIERNRSAKLFGVPMAAASPPGFPVQTVQVQRHLAVLADLQPEQLVPAAAALYEHFFVQHGPLKEAADFMPVLERVLGAELAARVHDEVPTVGKQKLEANTTAAIEDGAFGMPWFVVQRPDQPPETFWGVDHLGQVLDALDTPAWPDVWQRWMVQVDAQMWGSGGLLGDVL